MSKKWHRAYGTWQMAYGKGVEQAMKRYLKSGLSHGGSGPVMWSG